MRFEKTQHPTRADLRYFLAQARPRVLRTMRAFAEQEIIIPDGPYAGRRFSCAPALHGALVLRS